MKKIVALLLVLSTVFALCGCGGQKQGEKPDAVKNVERLIEGIGEVSLDKVKYIEDAEAAYEQLYEVDKALVDNHETLLSAREKYNNLLKERNEIINQSISQAYALMNSFDVRKAYEILSHAGEVAVTDEQLNAISECELSLLEMLYKDTSIVKLEKVYSFQNEYEVINSNKNGMTITYVMYLGDSTLGDYSNAFSAYKEYLEQYYSLDSTDYNSNNVEIGYSFSSPNNIQVSVSKHANGYPVIGYIVINISAKQ